MKYMFVLVCLIFGVTANAALIGNKGLQVMEYTYDFSKDGGAVGFIDLAAKFKAGLPVGASILRVSYYVQTAMTSSGSATVAFGDSGSGGRYRSAIAFDNAVWAADGLVALSGVQIPNQVTSVAEGNIGMTIDTAALTAGKISFLVEYVQVKR